MGAVRSVYPRYAELPVKAFPPPFSLSLSLSFSSARITRVLVMMSGKREEPPSRSADPRELPAGERERDLCESRYSDVIAKL